MLKIGRGDWAARRLWLLALLISAFALTVVACGDDDPSSAVEENSSEGEPSTGSNEEFQSGDEPRAEQEEEVVEEAEPEVLIEAAPAGYLVWAHAIAPAGLARIDQIEGGLYTTSWIREGLLESLYTVDAELQYQPELLAAEAAVTASGNGSITISYKLRDDLQWSDGTPLTSADVAYTHQILTEGCFTEADGSILDVSGEGCVFPLGDRSGYDLVTGFHVIDETTFSVDMAAFYPDWPAMYSQVFAAHAFGEDAISVARNLTTMSTASGPLPASGPLIFESWVGPTMRFEANGNYHGRHPGLPEVDDSGTMPVGVQISFVSSPQEALTAVEAGDAHLTMVEPAEALARPASSLAVESATPFEYEHLGLNLLNPHLADGQVRAALLDAVGRRAVVAGVYGTVLSDG